LSTIGMCMEMFLKAIKTDSQLRLGVVLGNGIVVGGIKYWFDADGKPYNLIGLKGLGVKKICVGACTRPAAEACDVVANGCGNVSELTSKLLKATGFPLPLLSMDNDGLPLLLVGLAQKYFAVRKLVKSGEIVDIPPDATSDRIFEIPEVSEEDKQKDWIHIPMQFTREQIKKNLKEIRFIPL